MLEPPDHSYQNVNKYGRHNMCIMSAIFVCVCVQCISWTCIAVYDVKSSVLMRLAAEGKHHSILEFVKCLSFSQEDRCGFWDLVSSL